MEHEFEAPQTWRQHTLDALSAAARDIAEMCDAIGRGDLPKGDIIVATAMARLKQAIADFDGPEDGPAD